ncbi:hypothetical protein DFJ58DRAFT_249211 [Suillus subalutaceus]|uniref:uncharacterized protein n=1 Tax=Suillus subalutaceus TaxID=48586 RepID=UPI001B86661B|nr:uncharacterized protein DFJ58DRAFT_249211 [Suillus subalutaceus]KAG1831420.1 hypothetical protein DFJ58DRAFT_249211 [Suillus subalutaceus]
MKFISLTTIVVSAAAMAGIAIASDDLIITPMGTPCGPANTVLCSVTGLKGYNNGNDYAYTCGPKGSVVSYIPCSCHKCCKVDPDGNNFQCPATE